MGRWPLAFACFFSSLFGAEDISGFWKSLNDEGKPQCIFGVYGHGGTYYGRVIGTYDDAGKMEDTIYKPSAHAEGVVGDPFLCGLDIVFDLIDKGPSFSGTIIDPTKGKTYRCELWRDGVNLIVRGKLFVFGKNITWYPAAKADFPKGFKMPDMKKFIPAVPQVK
jgi:uncharacterized protein (DUF2147 family)